MPSCFLQKKYEGKSETPLQASETDSEDFTTLNSYNGILHPKRAKKKEKQHGYIQNQYFLNLTLNIKK